MSDLQHVLQLARAGRFDRAIKHWRRLNNENPKDPNLWTIGGSLYAQSGDPKKASRCFKEALSLDKGNVQAQVGLAQLARKMGDADKAVERLRATLRAAPNDLNVVNALAMALRETGDLDEAESVLAAAAEKTNHPAICLNHANLLMAMDRHREARDIFSKLADAHPGKATLHHSLGLAEVALGNVEGAVEAFRRATELEPRSAPFLLNLARAEEQTGQYVEAAGTLEKVLEIEPDAYEPAVQLARVERELGRMQRARGRLDAAIEASPDRVDAYRERVALDEETNALDDAERCLEQALRRFPDEPILKVLDARLKRRRKRFDACVEQLDAMGEQGDEEVERRRLHELSLALDRLGEAERAWPAMMKFNELTAPAPAPDPYFDTLIERCRQHADRRMGEAPEAPADEPTPIFLVGFPRSGTTLMGRILGAHPETFELEETPILNELAREVGWPDEPLSGETAQRLRRRYFQRAADFGHDGRRRIVDRMPISLVHAPLIRTLWPDAPLVFMKRHPGDVCLSCLFQDFRLNWVTSHFRDPADTVAFYGDAIDLWLDYAENLDPEPVTVMYESLVESPEQEVRRVVEAIGLEFDEGMIEGRTEAPASKTASYAQVAEPIHTGAIGRWRAYETQFGKLGADLERYAEELGYRD